jgi:succinate dehydrogenase / fumarate reductase, flavoprotein subunit
MAAGLVHLGALNRNGSRGAHHKPDFPDPDDLNFMKTSIAVYAEEAPVLSYDVSLIEPRKRDYSAHKKAAK